MKHLHIYQAISENDLDIVRELTREYLEWTVNTAREVLGADLDLHTMLEYSLSNFDNYMPPRGRLLLVTTNNKNAGVVFLKQTREDTCEIKRLYVRPEFRGLKIGHQLLENLISGARTKGYSRILLDSGSFMDKAQALYRAFGFVEIEQYAESEVGDELAENMTFMELIL